METILALGLYDRDALGELVGADVQLVGEVEEIFTEVFFAPTTCPDPTLLVCDTVACGSNGGCCTCVGQCNIPPGNCCGC